jgi:chemotaxis response regulator CheB
MRTLRVLVTGAKADGRMQLRRILTGASGIKVVGYIRPGSSIEDGFQRVQADAVVIDAVDDSSSINEILQAAARRDLKVLILTIDGRLSAGICASRQSVLQRPVNLDGENSSTPFGLSLRKKLLSSQVISTGTSPVPLLVRPRSLGALARPELIAIGSSTGGPQALPEVLAGIMARVSQPIVITQHMPVTFTRMLATHLSRYTRNPAVEATDGMSILPGFVYIAPGGRHLLVVRNGEQLTCQLSDSPPESFCRPAVDPMLRSIAIAVGGRALAVILTGMGQDGLAGCRALVEAGGSVIAQDEATSVVWGMPGAVANAGLCRAVVPITRIADEIIAVAGDQS